MQLQTEHSHHHHHTDDLAHPHDHADHGGVVHWIATVLRLHSHTHHAENGALLENAEGIRVVWLALAALGITSVLQAIIVWLSGSVALFADTAHNVVDGLNSIPLLMAFYLARRTATRRYTYGYARAEDVAGVFIVLSIVISAGIIFWESVQKLLNPEPLDNLGWVAAAAVIGFLGNEAVALLQIRTGRRIGSAALVADGLHAQTDGLTSLAVLIAAGGSWLGLPILDSIIGLLIGVTILFITRDAAIRIWYRLMDAIEPEALALAETVIRQQPGVKRLIHLRMRWLGHRLWADVTIGIAPHLTADQVGELTGQLRASLCRQVDHLSEVVIQVAPEHE